MKISEAIFKLAEIQNKFGDLEISGGHLCDDTPLREISVTETEGMEVFPENPNGLDLANVEIDGVFLSL